MSVRDKKHIFVFSTLKGDMTVGSDDIRELAQQPWFNEFLDVGSRPAKQELPALSQEEMIEVRARQLAQQYVQQMAQSSQPAPQPVQPQQPAQPQPLQQPQEAPVRQSYMEITPDKMNEQMWAEMSPQEQQAYGERYAGQK